MATEQPSHTTKKGHSAIRVSQATVKALVSAKNVTGTKYHAPPSSKQVHTDLVNIGTAPTGYPWQTVGKIQVGWDDNFDLVEWEGSGVLVNRDLILTSSHIAPWGKGGWWMRFAAGFRFGETPFGWVYVQSYIGYESSSVPAANDYVVCKLYSDLGDTIGWMGTHWWADDNIYRNGIWSAQGYPTQLPIAATNIQIEQVEDANDQDKLLLTIEFAELAWTGGPLWSGGPDGTTNPLVVGVFSADANGYSQFAGGENMVNLVVYGIEFWEG